jgi:hypothetical protein
VEITLKLQNVKEVEWNAERQRWIVRFVDGCGIAFDLQDVNSVLIPDKEPTTFGKKWNDFS